MDHINRARLLEENVRYRDPRRKTEKPVRSVRKTLERALPYTENYRIFIKMGGGNSQAS